MDAVLQSKRNFNNGILHTPKDYKNLVKNEIQTQAQTYEPSADNVAALKKLAAPLAEAIQKEARQRYKPTELEKRCKTIFDPSTLLEAMEKDEHWADEDSKYGDEDFLWLCDYFNNDIEIDEDNGGDNDDGDNNGNGNDNGNEGKGKQKRKGRGKAKVKKTGAKQKKAEKKKKNQKKKKEENSNDVANEENECCGLFKDDDEWNARLSHWRGARVIMRTYLKR
jgi:hypothetical protein